MELVRIIVYVSVALASVAGSDACIWHVYHKWLIFQPCNLLLFQPCILFTGVVCLLLKKFSHLDIIFAFVTIVCER